VSVDRELAVLRPLAASAWRSRWQVELEAEARFARLAERLERIGAAPAMVDLALRASRDERRHAAHCAELARSYGAYVPSTFSPTVRDITPSGLLLRGQVLYEIVASCCITETESMGVLTTLLDAARSPHLRQILRELARDEVGHSRLGWAHLASEHGQGTTSFLGPLVPSMLEGSADPELFAQRPPGEDDEALLEHGVLPRRLKLEVFRRTLEEVVFPGLDQLGVETASARAWLAGKLGQAGAPLRLSHGARQPG
jgi:hypothetical protein